jgi:hypothetical protein
MLSERSNLFKWILSFFAPHGGGALCFEKLWRITFRLYMTFWPAHKEMRSIAAGQNVAEKNRTKAAGRLRFFVARAAIRRRSIYRPVMCRLSCFYIIYLSIIPIS